MCKNYDSSAFLLKYRSRAYLVKGISADAPTIFAGRSKNAQINASEYEYRHQEKGHRAATKKPKTAFQIAEVDGGLTARHPG